MQLRKNTKAYKSILEILTACQSRPDRAKLVRLYITRAGNSIQDRIAIEGIQGDTDVFYEMTYQSILVNLTSSNHQLHLSDDVPGIYFFHSSANKTWDETPFEFDDAVKKEFPGVADPPVTRKKEKAQKYEIPVAPVPRTKSKETRTAPAKKEKAKKDTKEKPAPQKISGPKQPNYKLRHDITFTNLDRVVTRQPELTRKDILDYYHNIAEYVLPYLKDRAVSVRLHSESRRGTAYTTLGALDELPAVLPDWLKTTSVKDQDEALLQCNDQEHLLLYSEIGCYEFSPSLARTKSADAPDYMVIVFDSPEHEIAKTIPVALAAKVIFDGLKVPAFVKSDGLSALHVYIPLDGKSRFDVSRKAAHFLCRLIALKVPDLVTLGESEEYAYGRVGLNYTLNGEGQYILSPYSLVPNNSAAVATPLLWDEINENLRLEDFNYETIFKRLKQKGDVFAGMFRKKVNARELLERLEEGYGFLFAD